MIDQYDINALILMLAAGLFGAAVMWFLQKHDDEDK